VNVFLGQIYQEVGASFPFSYVMQEWLGGQLSNLVTSSSEFFQKYGADFDLMVWISARKNSAETEIRGPAVFKKTKDVEYTVFLPYDTIAATEDERRTAILFLVDAIQEVFAREQIVASGLEARKTSMADHICSDPAMIEEDWE